MLFEASFYHRPYFVILESLLMDKQQPLKKMFAEDRVHLHDLIVALNEVAVLQNVAQHLANRVNPKDILMCFQESLRDIGAMYQRGEYYMSGLILAGEIMRQAMRLLMPRLVKERGDNQKNGTIILGTIEGDIHDLGKNMAAFFLETHSFEVIDLGVDVPPRNFLKEILQREPDAVGVSLLMPACIEPLKRLTYLVKETYHGRKPPPIFVGSGFLNIDFAADGRFADVKNMELKNLGIDYLVKDPFETLNVCLEICGKELIF